MKVLFPVDVEVNNKGEIFLDNNPVVKRTKNIDTRYHFIRQYVQNDIIKINLVQTNNNREDIFTNNTSEDIFCTHS